MATENEHTIGKLLIDFDLMTPLLGELNWEALTSYTKEVLLPVLDKMLNAQIDSNAVVYMDALELKLNLVIHTPWEKSLRDSFHKALETALEQLPKSTFIKSTRSKSLEILRVLFHYLEYGVLPWYAAPANKNTFETNCSTTLGPESAEQLLEVLKKKPIYFDRLVNIFGSTFFTVFINCLGLPVQHLAKPSYLRKALDSCNIRRLDITSIKKLYWSGLINISRHKPMRQQQILDYLIVFIIENSTSNSKIVKQGSLVNSKFDFSKTKINEHIKQRGNQLLQVKALLGVIEENNNEVLKNEESGREIMYEKKGLNGLLKPDKNSSAGVITTNTNKLIDSKTMDQASNNIEREPMSELQSASNKSEFLASPLDRIVYLKYAGIILIHPFLERFFSTFQLLNGKEWCSRASAKRAVQLLAYLATGKTHCPEYYMVLFKCMCGLPFEVLVDSHYEISEEEDREANKLLSSIITHWTALKETSITGLRSGFFERDGKLDMTQDGNWALYIEQKTQDILLSRLPWSLSIVRFRWLKNLIKTVWT